ncbi:type II secretion system protein N [uncultured Abyssibacter sp.]|uniref:type II secretion system protein N n=1 Tax=uncultured Abyssibacter sp. TaxID=2320202 RepID=UPI0032B2F34A
MTRLIVAFLVAFVIGLVIFLPVRTVYGWVAPAESPVTLHGITGTIVDAKVDSIFFQNRPVAEDAHWDWQPWKLLLLRFAGLVQADVARGPVTGEVSVTPWGTVQLSAVQGRFNITDLLGIAELDGIGIGGGASLDVRSLRLSADRFSDVDGTVTVRDLAWAFGPKNYALGDFEARFVLEEQALVGTLSDTGGPVALEGTVRVDPVARSYALDGRLKLRSTADPVLGNLISGSLGRPDPQGWYRLRQQGQL